MTGGPEHPGEQPRGRVLAPLARDHGDRDPCRCARREEHVEDRPDDIAGPALGGE
jgi:hypothetical protein